MGLNTKMKSTGEKGSPWNVPFLKLKFSEDQPGPWTYPERLLYKLLMYVTIEGGIPFLSRVNFIKSWLTEPNASAMSRNVMCAVRFICLPWAMIFWRQRDGLCIHWCLAERLSWVSGSIKSFLIRNSIVLSAKIWWNSFATYGVRLIIRKLAGSLVSPPLYIYKRYLALRPGIRGVSKPQLFGEKAWRESDECSGVYAIGRRGRHHQLVQKWASFSSKYA